MPSGIGLIGNMSNTTGMSRTTAKIETDQKYTFGRKKKRGHSNDKEIVLVIGCSYSISYMTVKTFPVIIF